MGGWVLGGVDGGALEEGVAEAAVEAFVGEAIVAAQLEEGLRGERVATLHAGGQEGADDGVVLGAWPRAVRDGCRDGIVSAMRARLSLTARILWSRNSSQRPGAARSRRVGR